MSLANQTVWILYQRSTYHRKWDQNEYGFEQENLSVHPTREGAQAEADKLNVGLCYFQDDLFNFDTRDCPWEKVCLLPPAQFRDWCLEVDIDPGVLEDIGDLINWLEDIQLTDAQADHIDVYLRNNLHHVEEIVWHGPDLTFLPKE